MDAVSYAHSAKQAQRIEKFIENPDSTSGVLTQPSVIQTGETVTVPVGRTAILANTRIDGTLTVDGTVFIPSGATFGDLETTKADKSYVDGKYSGFKNLIINPNKTINQRGITGTLLNKYYQDRWAGNGTGGLYQKIENINLQLSGVYTISWEGTATCTISRSTDNITYTTIGSGLLSGSAITLTANEYIKIDFSSTDFTKAQLEFGSVATPFEQRPLVLDELLCKRYYQRSDNFNYYTTGNTTLSTTVYLPVMFRATPTITTSNIAYTNGSNLTISIVNNKFVLSFIGTAATGAARVTFDWTADSEL